MAKKKENLKEMKESELKKKLAILQESIRVIKFKAEGSKSKNVKEVLISRRSIARILTEINNQTKSKKQ